MNSFTQTQLFTLAIVGLVIVRFLIRELRARTVRLGTLWIRPAILFSLTVLLAAAAYSLAPGSLGTLAASLLLGLVVGAAVGWLVMASTHVERSERAGRVRLRGSWVTVVIWIAALGGRFLVRSAWGGSVTATTIANAGTVALVAAAFTTISLVIRARAAALT